MTPDLAAIQLGTAGAHGPGAGPAGHAVTVRQTPATRGRSGERIFRVLCVGAVVLPISILLLLVADTAVDGLSRVDMDFLTGFPSRHASRAGIGAALAGSLFLAVLTSALALPLGVAAAVYLEEYGRGGRFSRLVELNIGTLAGVPSVIYGLLGLEIFVRAAGMGRSVLAGACTLALLILPVVIIASREAIRAVPTALREAALGLGASRWATIRQVVLPSAAPGILTGSILSVSRAMGEAAPLILVGARTFITFLPDGIRSEYSALPIQVFNWISRPQADFRTNAAAGILVLLATVLALNAVAIAVRARMQSRRS